MRKIISTILVIMMISGICVFASSAKADEQNIGIDHVQILTNAEKVNQDATIIPNCVDKLSASLARNEKEGMQFTLYFDTDVSNVKVTVSDLESGSGEKIPDVILYREHYISIEEIQCGGDPGIYPDALVPMFDGSDGGFENDKCDIAKGNNQGYWITVGADENTTAGIYTGEVTVSYDNGEDIKIPVSVEIWDFAIPQKSSVQTQFCIWNMHDYYGEKIGELEYYTAYWEEMLKYRLSGFTIPNTVYADHDPVTYVNNIVDFIDKHPTVTAFYLPLYGYPYNNNFTIEDISENQANINLYNEIKKHNLQSMALYSIVDEPPVNDEYISIVNKLSEGIDSFAPDIKHIVTTGNPVFQNKHLCWCPLFSGVTENKVNAWNAAGNKVWWYGCTEPTSPYPTYHINDALVSSRLIHWMQKDYGIEGEIYWAVNNYCMYTDGQGWLPRDIWNSTSYSGDGYLFYPGKEGDGIVGRDMIIPSIRIESIRDGFEDYEYLTLMEDKLQSMIDKYGITDITADELLDTYYDALYIKTNDYNYNSNVIEEMRSILAHDILNDNLDVFVSVVAHDNVDGVLADGTTKKLNAREVVVYAPQNEYVTIDGVRMTETKKDGYSEYRIVVRIPNGSQAFRFNVDVNGKEYTRLLGSYDFDYGYDMNRDDMIVKPVEDPTTPPTEEPVTPPAEDPITPPAEDPVIPPVTDTTDPAIDESEKPVDKIDKDKSPDTFDIVSLSIFTIAAISSLVAIVIMYRKQKD